MSLQSGLETQDKSLDEGQHLARDSNFLATVILDKNVCLVRKQNVPFHVASLYRGLSFPFEQ